VARDRRQGMGGWMGWQGVRDWRLEIRGGRLEVGDWRWQGMAAVTGSIHIDSYAPFLFFSLFSLFFFHFLIFYMFHILYFIFSKSHQE
jgi:hypothetical protein